MSDPYSEEDKPIVPMRCPRCMKKVQILSGGHYKCEDCGELYYDEWLGIWRIRPENDDS